MKKLLTFGLVGALTASIFMGSGSASAQTAEEQMTENYTINWDSVWSNLANFGGEVDFGTAASTGSGIGSLAKGSTAVSLSGSTVSSTGKTTGRVLSTVTSATTSLRDVARAVTAKGGKRMAVGTFTATSKASLGNSTGKSPFTGVTVHTATDSGKLYSSNTGNTKAY